MGRIQEKTQTEEKARATGAPQADRMRELAESEARRLRCEIERRFTSTGSSTLLRSGSGGKRLLGPWMP
jgi:hypothetical protein